MAKTTDDINLWLEGSQKSGYEIEISPERIDEGNIINVQVTSNITQTKLVVALIFNKQFIEAYVLKRIGNGKAYKLELPTSEIYEEDDERFNAGYLENKNILPGEYSVCLLGFDNNGNDVWKTNTNYIKSWIDNHNDQKSNKRFSKIQARDFIEKEKKNNDNTIICYNLSQYLIGIREIKVHADFIDFSDDPKDEDKPSESNVSLKRSQSPLTPDQVLWVIIKNGTISFKNYKRFIDDVMCGPTTGGKRSGASLPFPKVEMYSMLKHATECYMMQECRTYNDPNGNTRPFIEDSFFVNRNIDNSAESRRMGWKITDKRLELLKDEYLERLEDDSRTIPYFKLIREKLHDVPLKDSSSLSSNCYGILRSEISQPCLMDLIWSYWQEQGMLVQTINAISLRFQNISQNGNRDPLMRFAVEPLRGLSNLLWGYAQDEQHRLTIARRAYEYDHQFGLLLQGRAVPVIRSVESRSQFISSFHRLLYSCTVFFKEDDDTTRIADSFLMLNQLRELHMILAEGAHNQYGSLTWTARQEMLMQQWLISRPELREFLGGKAMVPYKEEWMDRVDSMRSIQGWGETSVTNFADLATYGEQILLSIRFGNWSMVTDRAQVMNWVRTFRDEIQMYIHAYNAVTGVDLSADSLDQKEDRFIQPSLLIQRKVRASLPSGVLSKAGMKRL
ncbi:MAG: hypothetical protein J7604_19375 [Sporocytophaga sp.]|uniref:hypothetical protein n=1 Tax=Sporocytophaga sp. TaxID=2231183 RepID=UPI001B14F9DA|nr:hypothetical protein [Sporocytophaga sp.]MBO9702380.1 hypothetical protein [Sporocytophaga sp.]